MVFTPKKKKKDWLNTSVNKENHHGLVYSKDCDIGQTEYWIIERHKTLHRFIQPKAVTPVIQVMKWWKSYGSFHVSRVTVVNTSVWRSFVVWCSELKLVNSRRPRVNLQVYLHNQRCWLKSSNFPHTYST